MEKELMSSTGRNFSDHCLVIVEGEWEENFCVKQVEDLVNIMW
jgi:hypothetical protein